MAVTETLKKITQHPSALSWAVTAGALLLFWLGEHLPLPGLSPGALASAPVRVRAESLAVFSLGVTPILTSWFIAELVRLLFPALGRARAGRLNLAASALALVLAGVQASSVGAAAQNVSGLVEDPGLAFRAEVIAAMVGATAVLLWLADLIDRRGVGDGLLLLFAGQTLAAFMRTTLFLTEARVWRFEPSVPWMWIGAIAGACALAGLAARGDDFWRGLDPWPPLLAFGAGSLLSTAAVLAGTGVGVPVAASVHWLSGPLGGTTLAILTAALFGLFVLIRSSGEALNAKAVAAQTLVVFGGGMLWVVSAYGSSVIGCVLLLLAAAITSIVARGQPRLAFE